ncbi:MAG: Fic family protein [Candidatus Bathyarchaeia archaeon]
MVWYPSVEVVIKANKRAVRNDKHRHKLRRSTKAISSLIDSIRESESMGLAYQSARFMKELVHLHAFDGGNHRTAYSIAALFLIKNGIDLRTVPSSISYPFAKAIDAKNTAEVEAWILENMLEL